jgi:hypothetical protein
MLKITRRGFVLWLSSVLCLVRRRPRRAIEFKGAVVGGAGVGPIGSTLALNSTGGDFLVCVSSDPAYIPRESEGNAWKRLDCADPRCSVHYCEKPKTAREHIFTPPAARGSVLHVGAYAGVRCIDATPMPPRITSI